MPKFVYKLTSKYTRRSLPLFLVPLITLSLALAPAMFQRHTKPEWPVFLVLESVNWDDMPTWLYFRWRATILHEAFVIKVELMVFVHVYFWSVVHGNNSPNIFSTQSVRSLKFQPCNNHLMCSWRHNLKLQLRHPHHLPHYQLSCWRYTHVIWCRWRHKWHR